MYKRQTYGDLFRDQEVQFSIYNFEVADVSMVSAMFNSCEAECRKLLDQELVLPAYDYCIKSSHLFNLLDARGAISVAERTGYIGRVRALARACAAAYIERRESMGFPLLISAKAVPVSKIHNAKPASKRVSVRPGSGKRLSEK